VNNLTQSTSRSGAEIAITHLRTDFLLLPQGVETPRPQLSWRLEAERRGVRQGAYQIEVAASAEALVAGDSELWDSGRVSSDSSIGIRYKGAALSSRQRCYWRVRVWDEHGGASGPSAVAWWEMGLLNPQDWSAQWLAAEDQAMREDRETGLRWIRGHPEPDGQSTYFRLSFSVPAAATATLFVAAYGKTQLWMDGEALVLPAVAPFIVGPHPARKISAPLDAGRHVVAVSVGANDPRLASFGFPTGEIAPFLRVDFPDGESLRINCEGWKSGPSVDEDWQRRDFEDNQWLDAEIVAEDRLEPWPPEPAMLMRCPFNVANSVTRARIYATALGGYELYINGDRVGNALLAPESTDFRKRALYRVYDVTDRMQVGQNVLGAIVGDGWYASYSVIVGRYPWGGPPRRLLLQLELTYADSSREVITSGPGWQISRSPILKSEIYDGEYYDSRLEQTGWSAPGFVVSGWQEALSAADPKVTMAAQVSPPIRRTLELTARSITEPTPGVFVFDFGQNFSGWCRLQVTGSAGMAVEMRFAELLASDGQVDQANLRSAKQTDTYVLKGDPGGEVFEPHFTYHGFRFVQVTGFPGVPTTKSLAGIVIHSDLAVTGTLAIGNPTIQELWRNTVWSQRSNFLGIPTDCPQRDERMGWMGDANVFWDAAAFNMDVDGFTRRFMADARDAQAESGAFPEFCPAAYKDRANAGTAGPIGAGAKAAARGGAPGWADAGIILPWTLWQRYGDTGIIEENWAAIERHLASILDANPDFLWRHHRGADYGDWLALDAKNPGDPTTPKDLVATAVWAHSVDCMAQMAAATMRPDAAREYRVLRTNIEAAFERNYIEADGSIGNGSQTGYILALRYALVPETLRAAASANLVADIRRRGTLLSTGFLGTPMSLDVLADSGYGELVYDLLLRTEFPSWGYMVAKGATTIWERWNSDTGDISMNSFNHYALGAVSGFLFRRIAGIAALEPGFRQIEVKPLLDRRVKCGGGEYESVLGTIATRWRQLETYEFELDLTIPPNCFATVHLPATPTMSVTEGKVSLERNSTTRATRRTDTAAIIEVGSGSYAFAVNR
jgi:alpha-L-rhamnosidase